MYEVRSCSVFRLLPLLLIIVCSLIFLAESAAAQPGWMKKAALDSRNLTAHKDASALIIQNIVEVKISDNGHAQRKVKRAVKVLKQRGEELAFLAQPIAPFRKIKSIVGWRFKANGEKEKLKKSYIAEFASEAAAGYYSDSRILMARFPELKPGDVVAYEYEVKEKDWTSFYDGFIFQLQEPTLRAEYAVTIPKKWSLHHSLSWKPENLEFYHEGNRYRWIARELQYRSEEKFAPPWPQVARSVSVAAFDSTKTGETHFADWEAAGRWACGIMKEQATPDQAVVDLAGLLTENGQLIQDQTRSIAEYVRDEVRYVGVWIGKGRFVPRPAGTTLKNLYGDCKDKSILMRSLLASKGISSACVLALVGAGVDVNLPTSFQFNHCIVGAPLEQFGEDTVGLSGAIADGWFFFDPTDPSLEFGSLPEAIQGSRVLVADNEDPKLIRLPERSPSDFRRVYTVSGEAHSDGSVSAAVRVVDYKQRAAYVTYQRRAFTHKDYLDVWTSWICQSAPTAEISELDYGHDADSAWVSFTVQAAGYAVRAGELLILRPDITHEPAQPLLNDHDRHLPIWFGRPIEVELQVDWKLPEGWAVAELSPEIDQKGPLGEMSARLSVVDSILSLRSHFTLNGVTLTAGQYADAVDFDKAISAARNLSVLLKQLDGNSGE